MITGFDSSCRAKIRYRSQVMEVLEEEYDFRNDEIKLTCRRPLGLPYNPIGEQPDPRAFEIEKVIYNDPATIVLWNDGTKTVVKCQRFDVYDPQVGFLMCIAKKAYGNGGKFNDVIREHVQENPAIKAVRDFVKSIFG